MDMYGGPVVVASVEWRRQGIKAIHTHGEKYMHDCKW